MCLTTLFLDLNSYFASVEQQLRPDLRGRPVAVVPVETDSTCCIAASYEAKAFGVRTGTNVGEAKRLCPGLTLVNARPEIYVRIHHEIVAAIDRVLPVAAIHSIDEMHCRLMGAEREPARAAALARAVKQSIAERVGESLKCSIGVAPNRFLAKVATELEKPDGLVVIERRDLPEKLHALELRDLPGIGPRMHERLKKRGIMTVAQLCALSEDDCAAIWQSVVGRIWYRWLRGEDGWESTIRRRSISHQHVLPPPLRTTDGARGVLIRLIHKGAARLRSLDYWAQRLTIVIRLVGGGKWTRSMRLEPTRDTLRVIEAFSSMWPATLPGAPLRAGIVFDELESSANAALPLFPEEQRRHELARTLDAINARYGRAAVYTASMHETRTSAPTRIAFQSIPDLDLPA